MQKAGGTCWSFGEMRRAAADDAASKDAHLKAKYKIIVYAVLTIYRRKGGERERGERERELTVKCETYNNYKANQAERQIQNASHRVESVAHYAKQPRMQGCDSL